MKSSLQRLRSTLLKLDIFGEPVEFTVDGEGSRKSCLGLLLSLVIFATVLPYSFDKYKILINYGDTTVSSDFNAYGKDPSDKTKVEDLSIAMQIMNVKTYQSIKLEDYFYVYAFKY